jgi:hypothetical protein
MDRCNSIECVHSHHSQRNPMSVRGTPLANATFVIIPSAIGLPKTSLSVSTIPHNAREATFCQLLQYILQLVDCSCCVATRFFWWAVSSKAATGTTRTSFILVIYSTLLHLLMLSRRKSTRALHSKLVYVQRRRRKPQSPSRQMTMSGEGVKEKMRVGVHQKRP